MRREHRNTKNRNLLSFETIEAASQGNVDAICKVLMHYERYILKLSTRMMKDEFGNQYYCVDETLRSRLEMKLIMKILTFKLEMD